MNKLITLALLGTTAIAASPVCAAPILGADLVAVHTGKVIVTFTGSDAGYDSTLGLVGGPSAIFQNHTSHPGDTYDLGSFAAGTVLKFYIDVTTTGYTFYTGAGLDNPDLLPHASAETIGDSTSVGFEDILGGGDFDYNDLTFSFTNTAAVVPSVPEPATWAMMLAGVGMLGAALRRRRAGNVTVSYA